MTGQSWGPRRKWLQAALVIGVAVASHALGAGSAEAATADGGSAAKDVVLAGFTAQHFPVFFKVSPDGRTVLVDGIALSMTCASGGALVWHDSFGRLPVHANGKVHASFASPTIVSGGTQSSVDDALTARLNPKHSQLTGTWHLATHFTFADGTTDQCDSGPVAFSATT
jgi:hypothetical protein